MKQGTVYFHRGCRFHDGEISDKLFVILNTPRPDEFFITCKTTSQPDSRPDREGCHNMDNLYVLIANDDFFNKKTWIQFHEYYNVSQQRLFNLRNKGIIIKKAELRQQTVRAIINCISKSEDICPLYLSMINR